MEIESYRMRLETVTKSAITSGRILSQLVETIIKRYYDYTEWQKPIKCINRDLDITSITAWAGL